MEELVVVDKGELRFIVVPEECPGAEMIEYPDSVGKSIACGALLVKQSGLRKSVKKHVRLLPLIPTPELKSVVPCC